MFDDLTLEELSSWKREVLNFMRSNAATQSLSTPEGVSLSVDHDNQWRILGELNQAIQRKLRGGGRFVGIEFRN